MERVTLVTTYYRQPVMLAKQLATWATYPDELLSRFLFVVVDDGSPEAAEPLIAAADPRVRARLELYRVDVDIPWNHPGARNLGCTVAPRGFILRVDLDHVLEAEQAAALLELSLKKNRCYRLLREWVKTAADGSVTSGPRKPHMDSYLIHRDLYWSVGGYDEDYSGCYYCVDTEFFKLLTAVSKVLLADVTLRTFSVEDSSTPFLSRGEDMERECKRRRAAKRSRMPVNPLRFPWHKVF